MRPAARAPTLPQAKAYLAFRLDGREYGVDVAHVREVRAAPAVEPELAVVDLRALLELAYETPVPAAALIVVGHAARAAGIVVDCVRDVVLLDGAALERPGAADAAPGPECLAGVGVRGERRLVLVDIERALRRAGLPDVLGPDRG